MIRFVVFIAMAAEIVLTGFIWQSYFGFYPLWEGSWVWFINYVKAYGHVPPFIQNGLFVLGGGILLTTLLIQWIGARAGSRTLAGGRDSADLHGSARWAVKREAATLFKKTGVVVGGWRSWWRTRMLRHDGPEHVMVFAPTGSGKGVSLIIPTLLTWLESVFCLDIKGENYALTSGWRASKGHRIIKFDPTSPTGSARFNPLAEVRVGTERDIADCQNIASMMVDSEGKGLKDYWMKEGWSWLSVLLLHVVYRVKRDEKRIACFDDVNTFVSGLTPNNDDDTDNFVELLNDMIAFDHHADHVNKEVRRGATKMLLKASQERSGVHSTAVTEMSLYADPIIARNTAVSDFQLEELMGGEQPVAFYLIMPPSDIDRCRPLTRTILNIMLRRLTERMEFEGGTPKKAYKHRLLLLLDEFTSVGKLDIFERALAFIRGYGIKAMVIVQDITQLHQTYGKEESIMSNCAVRVAFTPNKFETAKLLSDLTGKTTILQATRSRSGKVGEIGSVSDQLKETGRPLLTPNECMRLRLIREKKRWFRRPKMIPGDVLTFSAGLPPIRGRQVLYFQKKELRKRAAMPPPVTSEKEIAA